MAHIKKRMRILVCTCLLLAVPLFAQDKPIKSEKNEATAYKQPVLIHVTGAIDAWLESYLLRKISQAEKLNCDLLILEIDSPGGGLRETLLLCERLTSQKSMHTVAFVPNEALSGAALLSLACDEILMSPTARIGDCGPIFLAEDFMFRHAPEKIRSDLVARVRILAEQKQREPALAEAMVDMATLVHRLKNKESGAEKFVTERELAAQEKEWDKIETLPESGNGRFLTLSGKRAVDLKLAVANIDSHTALEKHFALSKSPRILRPNAVDKTVFILNHWFITGLLLLLGLLALGYELSAPGIGIGALFAVLCFALFFWSRFLGGTSGWLEVVLFLSGLLFLGMEIFVLPGFGIAGVLGIFLMISGLVLASLDFVLPETNTDLRTGSVSLMTVLASLLICIVVASITVQNFTKIPFLKRLMLAPPNDNHTVPVADKTSDGKTRPTSPFPVSIGDIGHTITLLRPAGKAAFADVTLDVVAEGTVLPAETNVRVIAIQGNRILVEQVLPENT
jgi:membrane-bound serine protease (ClpP class)